MIASSEGFDTYRDDRSDMGGVTSSKSNPAKRIAQALARATVSSSTSTSGGVRRIGADQRTITVPKHRSAVQMAEGIPVTLHAGAQARSS